MYNISIIIPIYNTAKYLEKCINSVIEQKIQNMEIILVNDGSTDESEEVVKNIMSKNENNKKVDIKYFKNENNGLAETRNFGIKKANGEYIMFLDSDDYLNINILKNLGKYMEEDIDLIKFKMETVDTEGNTIELIDGPVFDKVTGEKAFELLCIEDKFLDVACIYIYRREFWNENNFEYKKGMYHEDFGLTPLVILKANSVISTNKIGYYYVQTDNSITRNTEYNKIVKKAKDVLIHYDNMLETVKGYYLSGKSQELIKRYYTNNVLLKIVELNKNDQKEYIKEIRKRKLYENIKPYNFKQLIKQIIIRISPAMYLKMR